MTETIARDLELAASLPRVWRSLTDPERLSEWLAYEVRLDLLRIVQTRPLEILDVVGVPLPGAGRGGSHGPALVTA